MTMNYLFDYELNRRILTLAPRHEARLVAPGTFAELSRNASSGLVVWSGESERTVYGEARVNHAFRAWHDSLHLALGAPFDYAGELRVAREQARLISATAWERLIMAEVVGQVRHVELYGSFPTDQVAFTLGVVAGSVRGYIVDGSSKA